MIGPISASLIMCVACNTHWDLFDALHLYVLKKKEKISGFVPFIVIHITEYVVSEHQHTSFVGGHHLPCLLPAWSSNERPSDRELQN